jgi:hypothetical protein
LVQKEGVVEFPPGRGDAPEIWLSVDRTPPECRLTSAEEVPNSETRELKIFWTAADPAQPAENDGGLLVTLHYATHPAGPWSVIAAGIPNSGRHSWKLPQHVPDQVYLKLEVQDAAGNVGQFVGDRPVAPRRPAAGQRIQSIQPQAAPR